MTRSTLYRIVVVLILLLFSLNPGGLTVAAPDGSTHVESLGGPPRPAVLRLDPSTSTLRIPPPASYTQHAPLKVQSATINVTYLPNGATDGFGFSCLTWPAAAITAFEYAASIWETLITSTVPIEISACWTNFGDPDILGVGGADDYYSNFTGAPLANTLYPTALANALAGTRVHGSTMDIHVAYGSTFAWYFGTDGATPTNQVDFASVVLHEICHGLGFAGSMIVKSGLGYWGWDDYSIAVAYDHFTENGAGTDLLSYTNGSAALAAQLVSGNLYFNGTNANAANGGQRPKLFAPATWMQGSSYSHLDEIFNNTDDDLMTYAIPNGQSMHAPGPIAMGILYDVGWPLENTPPTLSDLPNQTLTPGQSKDNAIDLWAYASDTQDGDEVLTFSITNSPPLTVGVTIDSERYISITPTESFTGTFPVVVEVQDTEGLTDTNSFTITFTEIETRYVYLPLVLKSPPCNTTIPNGNFESGPTIWSQYSSHGWPLIINSGFPGSVTPRGGSWAAWLGGEYDDVSYIQQQVAVPACAPYLSYYHWIASADVCGYDFGGVLINGTVVDVYTLCGSTNTEGWVKHTVNLSAYTGQTVWLQIRVETDDSGNSNLFVDDVAFQSSTTMLQDIPLALDGRETRPRASELILTRSNAETPAAVERMLGFDRSR